MQNFSFLTCKLVWIFILDELSKIQNIHGGIYRDDGLACTTSSPRQAEKLRQKTAAVFTKHGLGTTSIVDTKKEDFLHVFFDLENETYRPFIKENNIPIYAHKLSNHPPSIIKNISEAVKKRLSSLSSNEDMFESVAPMFREALAKSGYKYELKFDPTENEPVKKGRNRTRPKIPL